ncbi:MULTISPECIES: hypothetical protein [Streptomyces]|uniref:XRE family transcriptional regulator n=1 Tax=Streptomyces lienomycini TaxID=284035 RepID=A0ABV9X803_9ACTN|nr:hypothetical protein [Streptomyces sp. NBC_00334]
MINLAALSVPQNPIAPCDRELERLALSLRDRRNRAGLSYKELAVRPG